MKVCTLAWAARNASWALNRFQPVKGASPFELVYGKSYKGLLAGYGEPVHGYVKSLNREKRDVIYACSWEKLKGKIYVLTNGVQVVLSKCIRRTDQDWSKHLPIYKGFNAFSCGYQTNFGGGIIVAKRRAEALLAARTDILRERVTLKFKDEVMAKALEGGSDSEKRRQLLDSNGVEEA